MTPTIANPQVILVKPERVEEWAKTPRCCRCNWPMGKKKVPTRLCDFCDKHSRVKP